MKRLLWLLPFLPLWLFGQSKSGNNYPRVEIGCQTGWMYGVKAEPSSAYTPLASGRGSMFNLDIYAGLRLGPLWIYPTWSWGIGLRAVKFNNPYGDYIPEGYGVSLPYDAQNPYYYYSDNYEYFISDAWTEQKSIGSFFTLMPIRGFEIGAGLFRRKVITTLHTPIAYDEYSWSDYTATTDEYVYERTYYDGYRSHTYIQTHFSVPLLMQFKTTWSYMQLNTGVVWLPGKNGYVLFRAGTGICF